MRTSRKGVHRREALKTLASGAAASALWVANLSALADRQAVQIHLAASAQAGGTRTPAVLSRAQFETVGVLVELIIPTTDTPGARAALVDRFIDGVLASGAVTDRDRFLAGIAWLDARSAALFAAPFVAATPAQQTDLLTRVSDDSTASGESRIGVEFFTALKTLTITGYYTTEIGLRQELGDDGRVMLTTFEGCTHPEHQ